MAGKEKESILKRLIARLAFAVAFAMAAALLFVAPSRTGAHAVEQIFVDFGQGDGRHWEAEVLFDAAFALPEFRENSDEPPPEREWLVALSQEEHARIRAGAEAYLRERMVFWLGEEKLAWEAAFPDYERSPPDFPKLLNGGAYTRVRLSGTLPEGEGGEVALEVTGGTGPNIVVAIGPEGEPRYVTVPPAQKAALLEIESTSGSEDSSTLYTHDTFDVTFDGWLPAVILGVVLIVALLLIMGKRRKRARDSGP